ncbi:MAG: hypothetical protein SVN78_03165 [Deferribacterota bacterium]|nr:hypothetical protein [Deferribacterota bacterium]
MEEKIINSKESMLNIDPSVLKDHLLLKKNKYNYYAVDLTKIKFTKNHPIVLGCKAVEDSTWEPQEDFFEYLCKEDILIFMTYKNEIIAFLLGAAWSEDIYGMFAIDEIMVKPSFQGRKLSKKLTLLFIYIVTYCYSRSPKLKQIVGFGTSCNPKTMLLYYNKRFLLLETNFKPKETLTKIAWHYVKRFNFTPLIKDSPFFLKGLYAGSHKKLEPIKKKRFILKYAPKDFDYINRGDCMLLTGRHYLKLGILIATVGSLFYFGPEILKKKNPGWKYWKSENKPLQK